MQLRRIVIIVGGVDAPVSILISVHKAEDWIRVDYLPWGVAKRDARDYDHL